MSRTTSCTDSLGSLSFTPCLSFSSFNIISRYLLFLIQVNSFSRSMVHLISHHQFLIRPVDKPVPTVHIRPHPKPLRDLLQIQHPSVLDLETASLWRHIVQSLDGPPHDVSECICCRGKTVVSDSERNFVLVITGDLRPCEKRKLP